MSQSHPTTAASGPAAPSTLVASIENRLRARGVTPRLLSLDAGPAAAGMAVLCRVRELLETPERFQALTRTVAAARRIKLPATLSLYDLGVGKGEVLLRQFLERLGEALVAEGVTPAGFGLAVAARDIAVPAFREIAAALLPGGPRYVALDRTHMAAGKTGRAADDVWSDLFGRRSGDSPVWPVYDACVRTSCPLLGSEPANALLPWGGLAVTAGSAWLPLELDITRFADASGTLCPEALAAALDGCIELGDRLLDLLPWADPAQADDARVNRRIAVALTGLGDLVVRRGADPADLDCLRELDRLVGRIHGELWRRSRSLADALGALPALAERHPAGAWRDESHRRDWMTRWHNAVSSVQVRHRNLLVLSPYSVLPRTPAPHRDFVDLLPVIAHADAVSFANPPEMASLDAAGFRSFHRRAWAIIHRRDAASFIAAGA